ncbi:MAG: hypothetical protein JNL19_15275 [Burkholderiales bacterium]|nr:hypothetical protein [Burkholderiales bacterium]
MKIQSVFALVALAVGAVPVFAQPGPIAPPAGSTVAVPPTTAGKAVPGSVDKLSWLTGCWLAVSDVGLGDSREVWLAPIAGTMLGMGQTIRADRTLGWEAMRLYNDGDTVKAWIRPGARNEFTMVMERLEDGLVSFALTEGDTTTRVSYQRRSPTAMTASFRLIRGDASPRGQEFAFKREDCGPWTGATAK